jgi:hypothetical protein
MIINPFSNPEEQPVFPAKDPGVAVRARPRALKLAQM